jgi:hypothetical protein
MAANLCAPRGTREKKPGAELTAVTNDERKQWRELYGGIHGLIEAARRESAAGNLGNAWFLYEQALAAELRRRWVEFCGKYNTPIHDIGTLRTKLRCASLIDDWTFRSIDILLKRPKDIGWRHLDPVATFVTGYCLENVKGGIACRA